MNVARQHRKCCSPQEALPGEAEVMEPASLAVAAIAAGNVGYGRSVLARQLGRDPRVIPALLRIWFTLTGCAARNEPQPGLHLIRFDGRGARDASVSGPPAGSEAVAEAARAVIAAIATDDALRILAAFEGSRRSGRRTDSC